MFHESITGSESAHTLPVIPHYHAVRGKDAGFLLKFDGEDDDPFMKLYE